MIRSRLLYISLILALIGGALLLRYMDPFFVRALRLAAFDSFQRLAPEPYDPKLPIRIVDIDEKSLATIGQWPWPRTTVRDLLLALTSKGAAVVAFDHRRGVAADGVGVALLEILGGAAVGGAGEGATVWPAEAGLAELGA